MRIIDQYHEIEAMPPGEEILIQIEKAGRTCYKSEDRIDAGTAQAFVAKVLNSGHHSVIEHVSASVRMITNRGVSHEIVRHRLASYSQESTRYCNYSKDRFDNEITVIRPVWMDPKSPEPGDVTWRESAEQAERYYFNLLARDWSAQQARDVLPNALKTEIVMTANMREWRHFFHLRAAPAAHPQMRALAQAMLADFRARVPVLFDDVGAVA